MNLNGVFSDCSGARAYGLVMPGFRTIFAIFAVLAVAVVATTPGAAWADHNDARRKVRQGEILPLNRILPAVQSRYRGDVIDVDLNRDVYRVRIRRGGDVMDIGVDGKTGQIIGVRGGRGGRSRDRGGRRGRRGR